MVLVALLLSVVGCGRAASEDEGEARGISAPISELTASGAVRIAEASLPFLTVETFGEGEVPALVRAPGRIAFRDGAVSEVGTPVEGRVVEVHVRVGERVDAGAPLFTLASATAASVRGELRGATVTLAATQAEADRQRAMMREGVGIASALALAEAEVARAEASLAALRATASTLGRGASAEAVVRAPMAGVILSRATSVGHTVAPGGEPLVVIGEPSSVWIVAEVFERELPLVREGQRARVSLASVPEPVAARVESVGGSVDPETRRAPVYLVLEGATEELPLRAGMYARLTIEVARAGFGLPTSAVLVKEGGRTVVFVEEGERTFLSRDLQVGHPVDGRVPVIAGLSAGDRVVTRGALLLDGAAEILR